MTARSNPRVKEIDERIEKLEKQKQTILSRPSEPSNQPCVLFFQKTYPRSNQPYTYTAVKAGGRWYLSGNNVNYTANGMTWQSLLDFIEAGSATRPEIWVASELTLLED